MQKELTIDKAVKTPLVLRFQDVDIRYDKTAEPILKELSFELRQKERVALLGLNGSGKTSLLLAAAGLVDFQGVIEIEGGKLGAKTKRLLRKRIGFLFNVPEEQLLFPNVLADVAFGLINRGRKRAEAEREAMNLLEHLDAGALADKAPHELSHGQAKRVALAGALVTKPGLLLLDEPSAGLDPPGKRRLARLLSGLNAGMLVATHDVQFAAMFCTGFMLLENGRIQEKSQEMEKMKEIWEEAD